jgi:predicted nucleotidyltransferase
MVTNSIQTPPELEPLLALIKARLNPRAIWLFGSRARGDARDSSDWDLLIGLPDEAAEDGVDPMTAWELQKAAGISATIVGARMADLAETWTVPNTLAFEVAREGRLLDV